MKSLLLENKKKFILYVLACFIPVITQLMQISIFAMIFQAVQVATMEYLKLTIGLAVVFMFLSALFFIISRMMRISYMRDVLLSLRIRAFDKILNTSYKHFNKKSRDVYISNLINDINTFENSFFISLINFIFRCGLYVVVLTVLFFLDWRIGLIIFGVSILVLLIAKLYEKKTVKLQTDVSNEFESFTVNVANTFNGLEILKLNNMEQTFLEKSNHQIKKLELKKLKFNFFSSLQIYSNEAIGIAVLFGLLIFLMWSLSTGTSYGRIFLIVQLSSTAIFPLVSMTPLINTLKSSKAIFEKITKDDSLDNDKNGRPNQFSFHDSIKVERLNFAYENKQIFQSLDFTIQKGKKYLIKGPSGAGKSTLIKLLSMIYDDYTGTITIDGTDLNAIKLASFNEKVSFIYQDVFLFEASLKDNITLFKDVSDEWVNQVCKLAGLSDFVSNLPDGLHTKISENGKNLSGGERQRVSIARALCKKSEILFVDEATSALNDELGRSIEQAILDLNATVIAISHKYFEGITNHYDYVLELKDGYINQYSASDYFVEAI
ncbi:MAG TPA: ABC transporter ATP-binding protein [Bacilli bacterium]|nr:ABC transporter ATP-binding protein [Bacilli bacterium]